jgi:flagellar basal body P-ring protein FlgI
MNIYAIASGNLRSGQFSQANLPSRAKARVNFAGILRGLKPPPPSE